MKTILKIYMFFKVFGLLTKKLKHQKKIKKKHTPDEVKIGSFRDHFLNADISVKGTDVLINIGGFYNEIDAMLWARMQTELWLKAKEDHDLVNKFNNKTLH